jgi:cell division protease FtsH
MDGFDDNTGVIVLAATNRPAALDAALTRPGRFDRMIVMPLPSVQGRVDILKVHARGKRMEPGLDFDKVARATAGFTGAQLMGVMNRAAIMAVRRGAPAIAEEDVFAGLEDAFYGNLLVEGEEEAEGRTLPKREVRAMSVYQAAKALVGGLTPGFDELAKVVACPGRTSTAAFVHWIPREEHLETGIMTRSYLEATLTVALAGRAAERLVYGEAGLTTLSGGDVAHAGIVARELVLRSGFGRTLGPACTTAATRVYVEGVGAGVTAAIESTIGLGSTTAASAAGEIGSLMAAAEAKAHFILATNYRALTALADTLMASGGVLRGPDALALLAAHGAKPLATARVDGFGWDGEGVLAWPDRDAEGKSSEEDEWTGDLPATRPPGTEVAPVGTPTVLVGGGPFSLPVGLPCGVGPDAFGAGGSGVDPLRDLPEAVAAAEARAGVGGGGQSGGGGGGAAE